MDRATTDSEPDADVRRAGEAREHSARWMHHRCCALSAWSVCQAAARSRRWPLRSGSQPSAARLLTSAVLLRVDLEQDDDDARQMKKVAQEREQIHGGGSRTNKGGRAASTTAKRG